MNQTEPSVKAPLRRTVNIDRETYTRAAELAGAEDRSIVNVVRRAVALYAQVAPR